MNQDEAYKHCAAAYKKKERDWVVYVLTGPGATNILGDSGDSITAVRQYATGAYHLRVPTWAFTSKLELDTIFAIRWQYTVYNALGGRQMLTVARADATNVHSLSIWSPLTEKLASMLQKK